jgi:uncharacterized protein YndB with AHSA1/START domain
MPTGTIHLRRTLLAVALAAAANSAALAKTIEVSPSGFFIKIEEEINANPSQVFSALVTPDRWWSGEHSYSNDAHNLSLEPLAGGCFCERWPEGSAEHGRVILVKKDALLRIIGSLGPLQSMAVLGVLEFATAAQNGKTLLKVSYRVNGTSVSKLDQLADPVDGVLTDQAERLKRFIESGSPERAGGVK